MSFDPTSSNNASTMPMLGKTTAGTVFVGNLSFFCDENHLRILFSNYGVLNNVEVVRSRNGNSLLYGFIDFLEPSDGERAVQLLHGMLFMGRRMRVYWAKDENSNTVTPPQEGCTVHVSFVVHDLETKITEESLYDLFQRHGLIDDITIRRYYRHSKRHMQYGYAFVDFFQTSHALAAVTSLHGAIVNGVKYDCSMSRRSKSSNNFDVSPGFAGATRSFQNQNIHYQQQSLLNLPRAQFPPHSTSYTGATGFIPPTYPSQTIAGNPSSDYRSNLVFDNYPFPNPTRVDSLPASPPPYFLFVPVTASTYPHPNMAYAAPNTQPTSLHPPPSYPFLSQPPPDRYSAPNISPQVLPPSTYHPNYSTPPSMSVTMHHHPPPSFNPPTHFQTNNHASLSQSSSSSSSLQSINVQSYVPPSLSQYPLGNPPQPGALPGNQSRASSFSQPSNVNEFPRPPPR